MSKFMGKLECNTEVLCTTPRPNASLRLFCFHHAGGAASYFRDWASLLPPSVEVCCVQQPGREKLFSRSLHSTPEELVDHTLRALAPWLDRPFAFLGHSFGAVVAYACVLRLIEEGGRLPDRLFISGCRALDMPPRFDMRSSMSNLELAAGLNLLGGVPKELADHPGFMDMYLPILRGDIYIIEQFDAGDRPENINLPITAFGGADDISVSVDEISQWSRFTAAEFESIIFPGGHFFISENTESICQIICKRLQLAE